MVSALVAIGAAPLAAAAAPPGGTARAAAASSGSLANGRWAPARNPDGTIADASWAQLPLNQVVEWAGTSLESQLSPPYGITRGSFTDWGVEGIAGHMDDWGGAAFDDATGRFWFFGGGHAGSSNNMLSSFDARTGKWSVTIPPTANEAMPKDYARKGRAAYTQVAYDGGAFIADNFVPAKSPPGDGKPCAMHVYSGIEFCDGEVVRLRGGTGQTDEPGSRYWHALVDGGRWEKAGRMTRPAHGVEQHATCWNGALYWGMEGGQAQDNQYWTVTRYDVGQRKEAGTFGIRNPAGRNVHFGSGGTLTAEVAPGKWLVVTVNDLDRGFALLDLASGTTERAGPLTGRIPTFGGTALGGVYVPELRRIVLMNQYGKGGLRAGEWIEIDPETGACAPSIVTDPHGRTPRLSGNGCIHRRIRYWSERRVLILHSRTMQNAVVIRFG